MIVPVLVLWVVVFVKSETEIVLQNQFRHFKFTHQKEYASEQDEAVRLQIFSENLEIIKEHNRRYEEGQETWYMGVNQFSDMTPKEFAELLAMQTPPPETPNATLFTSSGVSVPDSVDWKSAGLVTEVKNQGLCGACWSFSATGAVEGAYAKTTGQLISLSEQDLVDCDVNNRGCNGGQMTTAFAYIVENGITAEASYPFAGVRGQCSANRQPVVKISGYQVVEQNEQALKEAVGSVGPVSVGIDATYYQYYQGGIFYAPWCSPTKLNHAVLAVGYGTLGGQDYWLIKNSWGTQWGENGYVRAVRNAGNNCGIATLASFPVVQPNSASGLQGRQGVLAGLICVMFLHRSLFL